jgi:hypothetical protein
LPSKLELAELVAVAFVTGTRSCTQRVLAFLVFEHLQIGLPHLRRDVDVVAVVLDELVRGIAELVFLVVPFGQDEQNRPGPCSPSSVGQR